MIQLKIARKDTLAEIKKNKIDFSSTALKQQAMQSFTI